jgi:histone H3/H4
MAEYGRMFVVEAIRRAGEVARAQGSRTIDRSHIETVMAELLLDFQ